MIASLTTIRNKLASKIFNTNTLGVTVTVKNYTITTNKWGDKTETLSSSTDVVAVPYNHLYQGEEYHPFGDLKVDQLDMIFPYDTSITAESVVEYDSTDYDVVRVEKIPFGNGVVALVVRLSKRL